jgi:D-sedoheptulose 7-phosphate isomerase
MPTSEAHVLDYLQRLQRMLAAIDAAAVVRAIDVLLAAHAAHRTIYVCGNGGSAATASHLACDLGKNTVAPGRRRLRVMSLNDNMAWFSALANDKGYEAVFVEQLANLLEPGDVLLALSASGNSPNVLRAAEYALEHGAQVVALVGFDGGRLAGLAQVSVRLPVHDYGLVEDGHLALNHVFTEALRRSLAEQA